MGLSIKVAELLSEYAGAVALKLPRGWRKISVYKEAVRDADGDLRAIETARCDVNGLVTSDIILPGEEYVVFEKLYGASRDDGETWGAMLFTLNAKGAFDAKFYNDGTPLLDGDHQIAIDRLSNAPDL